MEEITSPAHDILVEDRVTGQTPEMEEELPGQAQAHIPEQAAPPDALVLEEEEIEEELIIEDFTIDGICGVY